MKPQRDAKRLEGATSATVSPTLIAAEFKAVSAMTFAGDGTGSLTVKPSIATREVLTTYEIDESSLELAVRLPTAYPLAPAELVCAKRVGISEARLRKWMLGISAILKHQNGAVAQGFTPMAAQHRRRVRRRGAVSDLLRRHPPRGSSKASPALSPVLEHLSRHLSLHLVPHVEQEFVSTVRHAVGEFVPLVSIE